MDKNSEQMTALLSELQTVLEKYGASIVANDDRNVNVVFPREGAQKEIAVFGVLNERLPQIQ
jgi:hypothetical protein